MNATVIRSYATGIFSARLKRTFATSLGRKDQTVNAWLEVRLKNGAVGYGEASGSLAMANLTPALLERALKTLAAAAVGGDARDWGALVARAWQTHARCSPAVAAFECALLESLAASRGTSLASWFGGRLREIESDITLSAWQPLATAAAAREARAEGFRTLKIKVGGGKSISLARIFAAAKAHPRARILLDGNQGLNEGSALRLVEDCLKKGLKIDLLEQPLPKGREPAMARLARRCPVPLAADESAATAQDVARLAEAGAAHVINIKLAKSGISRALEMAACARAAGLKLMIGCMAESARGLSASVHLAAGTGFFSFVDLDSDHLLIDGPAATSWTRQGPILKLN